MSEQRFNLSRDGTDEITHILDFEEEKLLSEKEVLDCLNMQNNEIKKLKNNFLIDVDVSAKIESYKMISVLEQKISEQQALIEEQNKLIEKLRWDLNKTRKDLDFFATLKVTAMKGYEPMGETTNLEHQTWTGGKR